MEPIARVPAGATIADVPCGGGVALRALSPEQDFRYLAVDLSPKMLMRAERRAQARSLQIELLEADMTDLPLADEEVDLFLSYSGLHMVPNPGEAVAEIARSVHVSSHPALPATPAPTPSHASKSATSPR